MDSFCKRTDFLITTIERVSLSVHTDFPLKSYVENLFTKYQLSPISIYKTVPIEDWKSKWRVSHPNKDYLISYNRPMLQSIRL